MLALACIVTGFASPAAVLPGSHPVVPRLGVRRTTSLPLRRMAPCICSGGRVGGRSESRKQAESEARDKDAPLAWQWFGPVQRAMAVLIPAVVIATACLPYGPLHGPAHLQPPPICQIPAPLGRISSEAELEALKCLSSSVNYPGSWNDIAEATRDYVEQPILLNGELATIRAKVQINHNAEMGQWTYPGWRADVVKALNKPRFFISRSDVTQLEEMTSSMDRQQMVYEKLHPSAASSVWKSARSNVGYAYLRPDDTLNVVFLSSALAPCILLNRFLFQPTLLITLGEFQPILPLAACIALPQAVYSACTSSSSFGFIPLVIVCTGCCLRAVLDDDAVDP